MNENADCVVALNFGVATPKSRVDINKQLAAVAEKYRLPIITQDKIAGYCKHPFYVVSRADGYLDTWDTLAVSKSVMQKNNFKCAVLVAHKAHIDRANEQADKQGLKCMSTTEPPSDWDRHSAQWWTRSAWLWRFHESIFNLRLKARGKL
jgi:hypothetical protein